jgi:hypothetical protein
LKVHGAAEKDTNINYLIPVDAIRTFKGHSDEVSS